VAAATVVTFGLSDAAGQVTVLPRAFLGSDTVAAINNTVRYTAYSANSILLLISLAIVALLMMRTLLPALNIDFAENYFLLLMSLAGYAYAICSEDLITLFVGLELGSLPVLVLIGINRESRAANEAALKYLLLSAFAIAFLLLGIALLYAGAARLNSGSCAKSHRISPKRAFSYWRRFSYLPVFSLSWRLFRCRAILPTFMPAVRLSSQRFWHPCQKRLPR
jgi:NADH-quinone oxidoreductase subunit N